MAGAISILNRSLRNVFRSVRKQAGQHAQQIGSLSTGAGRRGASRVMDEVAGSAAQTSLSLRGVNRGIDEALDGLPKSGFWRGNMTVGSNLKRGVGWTLGAIGVNKTLSSYEDEFGHQMSAGARFGLGAVKNVGTLAMGARAVTKFGRAGILQYNAKAAKSAGNRAVKSMGNELDNMAIDTDRYKEGLAKTKTWADADQFVGDADYRHVVNARHSRSQSYLAYRQGRAPRTTHSTNQREALNTLRGAPSYSYQSRTRTGFGGGRRNVRPGARLHTGTDALNVERQVRRNMNNQRRMNPISNRARRKVTQTNKVRQAADDTVTRFNNKKDQIRSSFGMKSAAKFSTTGMAWSMLKIPGGFAGAFAGKGALWGKSDEAAMLVGGAMGAGMLGGVMGGTLAGIASISRGNLNRTRDSAPIGRSGRSFSNISYNATLHGHRMNM